MESSKQEVVKETQVVLVLHELVTETVVVKLSGCQLVIVVLAVHDG